MDSKDHVTFTKLLFHSFQAYCRQQGYDLPHSFSEKDMEMIVNGAELLLEW